MNCEQLLNQLDDYLDGNLSGERRDQLERHLGECEDCRILATEAQEIQQALRETPVPPMRPGFASQAIKRATNHHRHHRRSFIAGFSSALAASLLVALFVGKLLPTMESTPGPGLSPPLIISLQQPRTVNLVFDVAAAMENATISIEIPENVEVPGFPKQHLITWKTSLQPGRNILALPLRGIVRSNSALVASIELDGRRKSIRIPIEVSDKKADPRAGLPFGRHV